MDVQMPEMDGLAATRAIREIERTKGGHTPIVALTAHVLEGDRVRCRMAGMDGYVSKPLRVTDLFQAISEVLPRTESTRSTGVPRELEECLDAVGGERAALEKIVTLFLEQYPVLLTEIRAAANEGDCTRRLRGCPPAERIAWRSRGKAGPGGGKAGRTSECRRRSSGCRRGRHGARARGRGGRRPARDVLRRDAARASCLRGDLIDGRALEDALRPGRPRAQDCRCPAADGVDRVRPAARVTTSIRDQRSRDQLGRRAGRTRAAGDFNRREGRAAVPDRRAGGEEPAVVRRGCRRAEAGRAQSRSMARRSDIRSGRSTSCPPAITTCRPS